MHLLLATGSQSITKNLGFAGGFEKTQGKFSQKIGLGTQ
jgi:hypothetical protein